MGMTPKDILEIISKESGVTIEDILSRSRKTEKVISRHIFCGILRKNYNYSLPFIGELVGRDHTTVIHATEQFNNRYRLEDNFKNLVDRINYHIELKS
jgi:chromosomal replication initiator protein